MKALVTALTVAAFVGAGQLGVAYALGILRWNQAFTGPAEHLWEAHLAWAGYITALSVAAGGLGGRRAIRRHDLRDGFGAWIPIALAALIGAALTVPLVAVPAGAAEVPVPVDPALNAGLAAGLGTAVGFFAALALLSARPVAGGMIATAVWVWLLAVVSAGGWLAEKSTPNGQRLGVLDLPVLTDRVTQDLVLPVMAGVAVLTGAAIAAYARWLGEHPIAVAMSGLAGPALVASAYLVAGPAGPALDRREPWLAALVAVGAGFAASLLVTLPRRRSAEADEESTVAGADVGRAVGPDARRAAEPDFRRATEAGSHPAGSRTTVGTAPGVAGDSPHPVQSNSSRSDSRDDDYVAWVAGLSNTPSSRATTSRRELPRQRRP